MKKFLFKTFCLGLIIGAILIIVNYTGDAARLFDEEYEINISKGILKGQNVTNISNYDERILQKYLIPNLERKLDLLILGSSRTMLINGKFYKNKNVFNSSVSGASIEDIIAIYGLYKSNKKLPETIILGVDPWIFNENNGQERWKSLSKEYYDFYGKDFGGWINLYKYEQLISPSYFQNSLKRLIQKTKVPVFTSDGYNISNTKMADGSLIYGEKIRNSSIAEVDEKVKDYLKGDLYSIENYNSLSLSKLEEIKRFVASIENEGIKVSFVLTPYHPEVYKVILQDYPIVIKVEEVIKELAETNNMKIYGSFNPNRLNMDSSFFYDGMHVKAKGIEVILFEPDLKHE